MYSKTHGKPPHAMASDGQAHRIVAEKNELKNAAAEIGQLKTAN